MLVKRITEGYRLTLEYGDEVALIEECRFYPLTPVVPVGAWVPIWQDGTVIPDTAGLSPTELAELWWAARDAASGTVTAITSNDHVSFDGGVCVFMMIPQPTAQEPPPAEEPPAEELPPADEEPQAL